MQVKQVLLIDQGNTRLKWVLARGGDIDEGSAGRGDLEEFRRAASSNMSIKPGAVLISSVAGREATRAVANICGAQWGMQARLLESREEQGGVRNAYAEPGTLGVDRWLAIVGAVRQHGKPLVIWDLGTATTLDAVDAGGQHLGGMIFPGPATMLESLRRDTKLNVPLDLDGAGSDAASIPAGVSPGRSTASCISRGVLAAQLGALNQFLRNVSAREGGPPKLLVTGGAADKILSLLDIDYIHDPWLVFRGMLVDE